MLQTLRHGAAGWVAKLFLGVLVLSFAVWGIADIFRIGGGGRNAAIVGDRKISVEEFRNAYSNELRRVSQQAKRVITPEQARLAGIGERVLGNMVNEAAIDARIAKLRLSVSDEEVAREVQEDEIFRGPTGGFDRATFNEILRQNNLSEKDYIRLQRSFTARKQLTDAMTANMTTPVALRQAIHAYNADSRSIAYLELKPEDPAAIPAPSEEALRSYYDEHKGGFRAPEYRKLAVLALDAKALASSKEIPDSEVRAYYEANKPKYSDLEKRSIEQISFPTLEEAHAAYDQIQKGELFEQVMIQRKIKPEDAFLGNLSKAEMFDRKVADAAFALKQGEVSAPVQGQYATVLLRVTGIQNEQVKSFDAVREEIRALLAELAAKKDVLAIHDKIDEARLGGATLEEIGKAQNLPVRVVDAVDRAGRTPGGAAISDLPLSSQLLSKAFEPDTDSDVVSADDAYVWFDVRGVTEARDLSFEEARPQVEARWREDEARHRLDQRADDLLAQLKGGKTLDQVAAAQKLQVEQAETTRSGGAPSIKPAQATAVFQTPVEGFGATAADETGSRLLFKVTAENIRPFDPAAPDDSGQLDKLASGMGSDVVSAFVQKLREDLGTRFDPGAIAEVVGGAG
ncbi:SurA N-terminal domain-containing protein [Hansschlegelia sp.]|uniref:SurA N-terminal domain-containing protein n=1 Tax=Hansschlegelia sp. TaxID=2041892 RepID=UPI002B6DE63A|nr:SurA N-terminal domain-containing protein [Hansschlegelia sp.]HVI29120.1 SurA N-terminal domain-containing protein [Hansschlegelia sp.]